MVVARLMIGYYHETACRGILMCIVCLIDASCHIPSGAVALATNMRVTRAL